MIAKFILRLIYRIVILRLIMIAFRKFGVPSIFHPRPGGVAGRIANYGLDKREI
jgi:hypothetical protein